ADGGTSSATAGGGSTVAGPGSGVGAAAGAGASTPRNRSSQLRRSTAGAGASAVAVGGSGAGGGASAGAFFLKKLNIRAWEMARKAGGRRRAQRVTGYAFAAAQACRTPVPAGYNLGLRRFSSVG